MFELLTILLDILTLHTGQVCRLPVHSHQSRDKQLVTQLFLAIVRTNVIDGMAKEQSVSGRAVDGSIENMADHFSLFD